MGGAGRLGRLFGGEGNGSDFGRSWKGGTRNETKYRRRSTTLFGNGWLVELNFGSCGQFWVFGCSWFEPTDQSGSFPRLWKLANLVTGKGFPRASPISALNIKSAEESGPRRLDCENVSEASKMNCLHSSGEPSGSC